MYYHLKKLLLSSLFSLSFISQTHAQDLISLFPIEHYAKLPIINPNDPNNNKLLIPDTVQQQRFNFFKDHYFGKRSPWNKEFISKIFNQSAPNDLHSIELMLIKLYGNKNKSTNSPTLGYGENFRPYNNAWIDNIAANMNIDALTHLAYQPQNRAIAIDTTAIRALPTDEVHFYSYKLAGQGYPFDNLQESMLHVGTPVYIIQETLDHAWSLVITPDVIDWVKTNRLAHVGESFIDDWQTAAEKNLASIMRPNTSVLNAHDRFLFTAQAGAVFPVAKLEKNNQVSAIMVPVTDLTGDAVIKTVAINQYHSDEAVLMPYAATSNHFNQLISLLINRPYGWGNMYSYNDCSAETKNLFAPFGIWLPRNSAQQATAGKKIDITVSPPAERLDYLLKNGRPYATLIYIGGHVMLYTGEYINAAHTPAAMTYQNMWGLRPRQGEGRAIVGESTFFPLMLQYPEDPNLYSQVEGRFFDLIYLDEMLTMETETPATVDLYPLMVPEQVTGE